MFNSLKFLKPFLLPCLSFGDGASQSAMDFAGLGGYGNDPDHDGITNNHDFAGNTISDNTKTEITTEANIEKSSQDMFDSNFWDSIQLDPLSPENGAVHKDNFDSIWGGNTTGDFGNEYLSIYNGGGFINTDYLDMENLASLNSINGKTVAKYTGSISGYEYSYDTHFYDNGNLLGHTAEMYADLSEMLGYEYSVGVAKGLEVVGSLVNIAMIAVPLLNTGSLMVSAGKAWSSTSLQVAGYTTMFAGTYSFVDEFSSLNAIYGGSIGLNTSLAMSNNGGQGLSITGLSVKADQEYVAQAELTAMYYNDVATGGIFDKLAGGRLYQGVFAGGIYYDATSSINTDFSVGKPFRMSKHSIRTNAPYSQFLPSNQAGTDTFTVV